MAGDWIAIRTKLGTNPKTIRIANELDLPAPHVVGLLVALWGWGDEFADEDGNVPGVSFDDISRVVGVEGFALAVSRVGWLDAYSTKSGIRGVKFPDWEEYMSQSAKRRLQEARKKRRQRRQS